MRIVCAYDSELFFFLGFNRKLLPLKIHPPVNALDIQCNVYSVMRPDTLLVKAI